MKAKFAFSLICLLSLGTFAFAQEFRASISGHVTDSTGASVPLAKVQATNLATKEASNATTDNSGSYSIPLLQPGVYRSEEHTSELQSLRHLVCRLLLEKKKKQQPVLHTHHPPALHHWISLATDAQ